MDNNWERSKGGLLLTVVRRILSDKPFVLQVFNSYVCYQFCTCIYVMHCQCNVSVMYSPNRPKRHTQFFSHLIYALEKSVSCCRNIKEEEKNKDNIRISPHQHTVDAEASICPNRVVFQFSRMSKPPQILPTVNFPVFSSSIEHNVKNNFNQLIKRDENQVNNFVSSILVFLYGCNGAYHYPVE